MLLVTLPQVQATAQLGELRRADCKRASERHAGGLEDGVVFKRERAVQGQAVIRRKGRVSGKVLQGSLQQALLLRENLLPAAFLSPDARQPDPLRAVHIHRQPEVDLQARLEQRLGEIGDAVQRVKQVGQLTPALVQVRLAVEQRLAVFGGCRAEPVSQAVGQVLRIDLGIA